MCTRPDSLFLSVENSDFSACSGVLHYAPGDEIGNYQFDALMSDPIQEPPRTRGSPQMSEFFPDSSTHIMGGKRTALGVSCSASDCGGGLSDNGRVDQGKRLRTSTTEYTPGDFRTGRVPSTQPKKGPPPPPLPRSTQNHHVSRRHGGGHVDYFSFTAEKVERVIQDFMLYGFVEMTPNEEFRNAALSKISDLELEARHLQTTTNDILLKFVDEGMSTALQGDNMRKMLHVSKYVKRGPYSNFFAIMKELNDLFFAGLRSASKILATNEAMKNTRDIAHECTECIDIISKPPSLDGSRHGAQDQHRHLDAMFKNVMCNVFLFIICMST